MRERELKLAVGDTFMLPELADVSIGVGEVESLESLEMASTYHDTADLRLARHNVTLRYRVGDEGGATWTLKLPVSGADGSERLELNLDGAPGEVPTQALHLVAAWVRHAHLAPAATLTTRRRRWLLRSVDRSPLAELDLDEVSIVDGERVVARFRELELESRGPSLATLAPIARRLQSAGATPAPPVPKAVRALGPRATAAADVVIPAMPPRPDVELVVRAAIATAAQRLRENDAPTRLGDDEAVHQMRVATRRLRSDLRTFREALDPGWADGLADELRWLGSLLGAVRDTDVELIALQTQAPDLLGSLTPLTEALTARGTEGRAALLEAMGSPRYLDLLDRLVDAARTPLLDPASEAHPRRRLRAMLRAPLQRLVRRAGTVQADAAEADLHTVRIAAKRARYAAEAIGPYVGAARRAARVAGSAARMQELLGRLQDAAVLRADVERVLAQRPADADFALAAGRLIERQELVQREVRTAYHRARRAVRRSARRWMRSA